MTSGLHVSAEIQSNITRLHALIWQPAFWMHEIWWKTLALEAWQPVYHATPSCRRWIDQAVVSRRGFPDAARAYSLTPLEGQVLDISDRLPAALLALGLLRLAQPEYWLLKPYLDTVQPYLDRTACSQLNLFSAFHTPADFHVQATWVEPQQLIEVAWKCGAAVLASALATEQTQTSNDTLRALEILFIPGIFSHASLDGEVAIFGLKMLFRLARFL